MTNSETVNRPADSNDVPFPSWEAWNRIVYGEGWPNFEHNRETYESQKAFAAAHATHMSCVSCKERFSDLNCRTQAGWQETQISGLCERCFDEATAEPEDDEPGDPDGECYRGGEYASALAEEQARIQRELK